MVCLQNQNYLDEYFIEIRYFQGPGYDRCTSSVEAEIANKIYPPPSIKIRMSQKLEYTQMEYAVNSILKYISKY